jgi:hypothetical protein
MGISEREVSRFAAAPDAARVSRGRSGIERLAASRALPGLIVAVVTCVGVGLRLAIAHQSIFADEISTYWIVSSNGLGGVVSTVHSDAEITPPLYFVLAWLVTRIELTPELLRATSLVAGATAIPLTYVLGLRTVGRRAALVAATLTALSPFMVFYSTEARGYELAIVLVILSTLAMLAGVDSGRARWWVAYGACSCAAAYTHYTVVFALAGQLVWLLWAHPGARKPALLANVGAVVGFLPWTTGLINDFHSPTTKILSALDVFTLHAGRLTLEHWLDGYPIIMPNTPLRGVPSFPALALLGLGVAAAVASVGAAWTRRPRRWPARHDRTLLIAALALASPVGVTAVSLVGTHLLSVRHLSASWPAFSLLLGALLVTASGWLRPAAVCLVIASFAIGAVRMLEPRFQRPDYQGSAQFVDRHASPHDVVIDVTNLSPSPPTALDVALDRPHRVFHIGRYKVEFKTFKILAGPRPAPEVTRRALATAHGGRVFVVSSETVRDRQPALQTPITEQVLAALPRGYRRVAIRTYPGILRLAVVVYARRASARG